MVAEIAAARPGSATVVLPPVRNKADLQAIAAHVGRSSACGRTSSTSISRTPFACQYGLAAALATPRAKVIAVEHAPMPTEDPLQRGLRRLMVRRLAAHVSVGDESARMVERMLGLAPGSVRTIYNGVPDVDAPPVDRPGRGR